MLLKKMNVLLVNPWIYDFAAYDLWLKPVGLLKIASFLERFGYRVHIVNCLERNHPLLKKKYNFFSQREFDCGKFFSQEVEKPILLKDIPRKYKRYGIPPDIFEEELSKVPLPLLAVGITSGMTYWYPGVFEVIGKIKERFPSVPIVLGGIYATLCPEHARKLSGADYVVKGRGEISFLKILDGICGIRRDYSKIHLEKEDERTIPSYHLLRDVKSVAMLTSRGCPLRCSYCASHLLEEKFIQYPPEKVIAEIEYYVEKLKVKDIAFYDDALLLNPERHIIPILEKVIKKFKGKVRFHTPNGLHTRFVDRKIAKLFYAAGFKTIRLSFESVCPKIQKTSCNKVTESDLLEAIKILVNAGYKRKDIGVYIMVGLPEQTLEEVMQTVKFVLKEGVTLKIAEFSPIPGTAEFKKALEKTSLPLDKEPLLQNNSTFFLWNKNITLNDLLRIKNLIKKGGKA